MNGASIVRSPLTVIVLLGLALRLINLPGRTTEYDEVLGIWFAAVDVAAMVRGTAADTMPPLYYGLLHLWSPSPAPLWWGRLPSVVLSTATLPVLYVFGGRTLGRTPALTATLLMAISPFFIYFAQFIKMYALLTLLALLAALCLYEALTTARRWVWGGFVIASLAALYTHNIAAISLIALHLAAVPLFAAAKDRRQAVVRLVIADVIVAVGYLPWLAYLPGQLEKINRAFWIPVPGAAELVRTPVFFLFNLPVPDWSLPVLLFWTVLLAVAVGRAVVLAARERDPLLTSPGFRFVSLLAVLPVMLMFLVSQVRPIYVERGVMVSAAAGYLLIGWAVMRTRRPRERYTLIGGTVTLMAAALVSYYSYAEFPRSRYQEAADFLTENLAPGDAVLHETKLSYFPMRYFRPELPHYFVADPPGSSNDTLAPATMAVFNIAPSTPADLATVHLRVWAVLYQRSFAEAARAGGSPAVVRELSTQMQRGEPHLVGDIVLVPFTRNAP